MHKVSFPDTPFRINFDHLEDRGCKESHAVRLLFLVFKIEILANFRQRPVEFDNMSHTLRRPESLIPDSSDMLANIVAASNRA